MNRKCLACKYNILHVATMASSHTTPVYVVVDGPSAYEYAERRHHQSKTTQLLQKVEEEERAKNSCAAVP